MLSFHLLDLIELFKECNSVHKLEYKEGIFSSATIRLVSSAYIVNFTLVLEYVMSLM